MATLRILVLAALGATATSAVRTCTPRPAVSTPHSTPRRAALSTLALASVAAVLPASPAAASYSLYKASSDSRDEMIKAGKWKQGRDIDDAAYQGLAARNEAQKARRELYAQDAKQGKAGKFCAGQMSVVSPQMENICVRYGLSKADKATQYIDEFGNAQQRNTNVGR